MSSVLRSSLLNIAATAVSLACGFLVNIAVARLLGPAGSGTVAFMLWLAIAASAIADLGLPQTVLRYLAASDTSESWRRAASAAFARLSMTMVILFAAFLLVAALQPFGHLDDSPALWTVAGLLFVVYLLSAFSAAAARGRNNFAEAAGSTFLGSVLQLPLVFLGAWFFGAAGALAGMAVRYLPQVLRLPRYVDFTRRPDSAALTGEMRRYARGMWVNDLVEVVLLTRAEYLVLGFFLSTTEIGYYAAAIVFSGLISQFAFQLSSALLVGFSARVDAEDRDSHAEKLYRDSLRLAALFILPAAFGGAAIIAELLPFVFGEAFRPSASAVTILMVSSSLGAITVVPWAFLAARGESRRLMRITVLTAGLLLVVLPFAVSFAGIEGAAVARLAAEALSLGLHMAAVARVGGPMPPVMPLLRTVAAAVLTAAVAFGVTRLVPGAVGILPAVAAGAITYAVAVRMLRLVDADEARLLHDGSGRVLPARFRPLATRLIRLLTGHA
jgi:O-antigen/teichoic acid export membrane protein